MSSSGQLPSGGEVKEQEVVTRRPPPPVPPRPGDKRAASELDEEPDGAAAAGGGSIADVGGLIASMNRLFDFQKEDELLNDSETDSELDEYGSSCGDDSDHCGGPDGRCGPVPKETEGLDQMIADKKQRALRAQLQDMRKQQQQQPKPPVVAPKPAAAPSAAAIAASSACSAPQSSAQLASGEDFDL